MSGEVTVVYWCSNHQDKTGLEDGYTVDESKLLSTVSDILATGLNVMISHKVGGFYLWVDDKRFQQR